MKNGFEVIEYTITAMTMKTDSKIRGVLIFII